MTQPRNRLLFTVLEIAKAVRQVVLKFECALAKFWLS